MRGRRGGLIIGVGLVGLAASPVAAPVREAVRVRIWDDEGKKPGVVTPEFRHYVPLLKRVVEHQGRLT